MVSGTSSGSRASALRPSALLAALLWAQPSAAFAQAPQLGVQAGLSRSEINARGDESLNVAIRHDQGFVAGLFGSWPAEQAWLRAEVNFVRGRSRIGSPAGSSRVRLDYLEVPFLVGFSGPTERAVRLRIFGGGYAGWLLSSSSSDPSVSSDDFRDGLKSIDAGWVFGFGVDLHGLQVDARYSGGVVNLSRAPDLGGTIHSSPPDTVGYRNRRFGFVIGVPF